MLGGGGRGEGGRSADKCMFKPRQEGMTFGRAQVARRPGISARHWMMCVEVAGPA